MEMIALFRKRHPELLSHVAPTSEGFIGYKGRRLLSILNCPIVAAAVARKSAREAEFSSISAP
jgi:hypothetical protein